MRTALQSFFLCCGLGTAAQDPVIQAAIDAVSIDTLTSKVAQLSGEVAVDVGGGPVFITSRHKMNAGNAVAETWLMQELTALGYAPYTQSFSATGFNVLAAKPGALHPGRKVILCAHYDAMPAGFAAAPAADDDGSGTCSVIEAARVLDQYTFENTIVFALWDEEEQGKVGSAFYAGVAASNDDTLLATVNMDAIAYDGNADGLARIHARPVANSLAIKDTALACNTLYGLNINLAINNPGATYSDHASFWTEGYGAILVIEDFDNDGNPHYHTTTDLLQYLSLPMWSDLTKLSIATAATFAVPYDNNLSASAGSVRQDPVLFAYPVPSSTNTRVFVDAQGRDLASLVLIDALGRVVHNMHEGPNAVGAFDVRLGDLAPGAYRALLTWPDGSRASIGLVRSAD
jgi:hypothetical protein